MTSPRTRPGAPAALAVPAAVGAAVLALPVVALVTRATTGGLTALADPAVLAALRLSLVCAAVATALSLLLGVPLAWVVARSAWPGTRVLRTLTTLPMVLPPVVGGVALLALLGRRGLLGTVLWERFGITVPFSTLAVVLAQTFVALPFLVVTVEGALRAADTGPEEVAATLGASRWYVARRITAPRVAPAIAAGAVLAFTRALGEFGATVTFAGSLPGVTRTLPVAVYLAMEQEPGAAVAMSLLLVALSAAALLALRGSWASVGVR